MIKIFEGKLKVDFKKLMFFEIVSGMHWLIVNYYEYSNSICFTHDETMIIKWKFN
jgi:hypothetical protein